LYRELNKKTSRYKISSTSLQKSHSKWR